ncbi:hypothetical protein D9756_003596 [Leucocoprinus leucothites]|uniref:Nitrogen regulatory protein areA GATA-like domain-containing protein n=1 Tax=Leucocoprinus leucothites TaxID=201217 RepID=A0A8H5G6P2_9AGAR|nr:hypothetical protein D9756_003596 [Leucoagaricus leucothites]
MHQSQLPRPVLTVAADVVRQLEGEDALPLLWTLFSKCKESLKDGRRLENISWRLWHKALTGTGFVLDDPLSGEVVIVNEKTYRPPTPEEIPQLPPITSTDASSAHGLNHPVHSSPLSLSPTPSSLSSRRRNSHRRASSTHVVSVGQVLCELLPTATLPSLSAPVPITPSTLCNLVFSPTPQSGDPRLLPSISLPLSSPLSHLTARTPAMTLTAMKDREVGEVPSNTSLPTPEAEHVESDCSLAPVLSSSSSSKNAIDHSTITMPPIITTNHSSVLPQDKDTTTSACLPPPPRLVVVNPTPNLTPHPTPPATPVTQQPVASHVKQNGSEASLDPTPSLLRVPGREALARTKTGAQENSRLRLAIHEPEGKEEAQAARTSNIEPASSPSQGKIDISAIINTGPGTRTRPDRVIIGMPPSLSFTLMNGSSNRLQQSHSISSASDSTTTISHPSRSSSAITVTTTCTSTTATTTTTTDLGCSKTKAQALPLLSDKRPSLASGGSGSGSVDVSLSVVGTTAGSQVTDLSPTKGSENGLSGDTGTGTLGTPEEERVQSALMTAPPTVSSLILTPDPPVMIHSSPQQLPPSPVTQTSSPPPHRRANSSSGLSGTGMGAATHRSRTAMVVGGRKGKSKSKSRTRMSASREGSSTVLVGAGVGVPAPAPAALVMTRANSTNAATAAYTAHNALNANANTQHHHANGRSTHISGNSRQATARNRIVGGGGAGGGRRPTALSRKQSTTSIHAHQAHHHYQQLVKESAEGVKRAVVSTMMFNIGSGSEEGTKSTKSTGSGSLVVVVRNGKGEVVVKSPEVMESLRESKGKEKEKEVVVESTGKAKVTPATGTNAKPKSPNATKKPSASSSSSASLAVPPRVEATLADPLLPNNTTSRRIVVTSSDEYEDDEDEDFETETESWTGTESNNGAGAGAGAGDAQVNGKGKSHVGAEQQRKQQEQAQMQVQLQQQQQQRQQQQLAQAQAQAQAQVAPPQVQRPPPLTRNHSHNPGGNRTGHHTHKQALTRAQLQHQQRMLLAAEHHQQQRAAATTTANAATTAGAAPAAPEDNKWKEDLFVKLPKSSFQDLAEIARTRSVGLLSQLLNPDPRGLPVDHPYRRGFSSGMIQPLRPFTPLRHGASDGGGTGGAGVVPQQGPQYQQLGGGRVPPVQVGESRVPVVVDPVRLPQAHAPPLAPAPPPIPAPASAVQPSLQPQPQPVPQRQSRLQEASTTESKGAQQGQHSRTASRTYQLPKRLAALKNPAVMGGGAAKTPVATAVMSELRVGSVNGTKQVTTGGPVTGVSDVGVKVSGGGVGVSVNGSGSVVGVGVASKGRYKPKAPPPETVMEDTSDEDGEDEDNRLDLSKSVAQEKLKALLEAKKLRKSATAQVADLQQQGYQQAEQQAQVGVDGGQPVEPISIPPPRLYYPYNLPPPNPPTTPRTTRRKMLAVEIPESLRRNLLWERQVSQAHPRGLKRSASSGDVQVKGWEIPNVVKLTPKGLRSEPEDEQKERTRESRRRYLARTRSWLFEYHVAGW